MCKGCLDAANVYNVFKMEPADSATVKSSSLNPFQHSGESGARPPSAYVHLYNTRFPAEACVCVCVCVGVSESIGSLWGTSLWKRVKQCEQDLIYLA